MLFDMNVCVDELKKIAENEDFEKLGYKLEHDTIENTINVLEKVLQYQLKSKSKPFIQNPKIIIDALGEIGNIILNWDDISICIKAKETFYLKKDEEDIWQLINLISEECTVERIKNLFEQG